jgi:hypothetical protein
MTWTGEVARQGTRESRAKADVRVGEEASLSETTRAAETRAEEYAGVLCVR